MKLNRPPPRTEFETIVPLIDVVFFLLVFFMLVGRLDATAPFEVDPPVATTGSDMPGGGQTVAISRDGALALDGRPTEAAALLETLRPGIEADPALFIRVNAHAATELRHVLPLVSALEGFGARNVSLVVTPPAAEP